MGSGVQIVCVAVSILGLIAIIVTCIVPRWKVSAFVGQNIVTAQSVNEGIWMSCVTQSTGQQQCKKYDSMLQLGADLQAARAMTIIAGMIVTLALLILFAGSDFVTCVQNEDAKPKMCLVAGIMLLVGGLLLLVPVSWSAHRTISDFNNAFVDASQKKELGACIFVGWAGGCLLLLAGGLLCCFSRVSSSSGSGGTAKYRSNGGASAPNYV
ncbi:claudin i [Engraulis encrasicolus]|uniref:claudin i n=1 Tax=Engraulis encrasicolus TaxID=184585 RepID=UPI002FD3A37A